ncbi:MAG: CRISPR-associated endonuclease Cas2, partial [Verrucomicrobiae bacterium]|nr:CRISPR-associated endonuclease Cas2 [Verrucomicrobiae bacterium]
MSDNARSTPEEEELLPDERPRPEKSDLPAASFSLQPSTGDEVLPRRRSRGKTGRDPIASKYRMAWVLVFFDLPVGTPEERKAAANFRKDLVRDGYIMVQYSVYARPCGSADRVETQVRRLKPKIPPKGEVRSLIVSDAQWGRMLVMRSQQKVDPEPQPEQM